jgi:hypothetical protein
MEKIKIINTKYKTMEKDLIKVLEQVFEENEGLAILKEGIGEFLKELTKRPDELALFSKAISFFIYYATPILQIEEKEYHRTTNMMLIIIFSLIEGLMQDTEFKDFARFLREKMGQSADNEIVNKVELLKALEEEYRAKYGSIEKVRKFFNEHISEDDKNFILEKYKNGEYNNIEKVLKEIYKMRSEFVHNLGFEKLHSIDALLEIVKVSGGKHELEIQATLNIKDFMSVVWVGILRKFKFDEKKLGAI